MLRKKAVMEKEVKQIEEEILRCKYKIMMAFNYASEKGGNFMFGMQEACGLKEAWAVMIDIQSMKEEEFIFMFIKYFLARKI